MIPGHPVRCFRRAREYVDQHGDALQAVYGVSRWTQIARLFVAGFKYSVRPDVSAAFWAFARPPGGKWPGYLTDYQVHVLLKKEARARLNSPLLVELSDKRRFADFALAHGLPAEPLIARFPSDADMAELALPEYDLFAKPADYYGGHGARRWLNAGPARWTDESGNVKTAGEILAELRAAAEKRPHVLMRCLRPHPAIARLTGSAVICTVRCVTVRTPSGAPALVRTTLRLGVAGSLVDNRSSGGMLVAVNPDSGRYGRAVALGDTGFFAERDDHPDTGVPFAGGEVPDWEAVRNAALTAQAAIPSLPMMAWDVACTDAGPVILEANWGYAVDVITLAQGKTIADTPIPGIIVDMLMGPR